MPVLWQLFLSQLRIAECLSPALGRVNVKNEEIDEMLKEAPGPINFTVFLQMFGEKLKGKFMCISVHLCLYRYISVYVCVGLCTWVCLSLCVFIFGHQLKALGEHTGVGRWRQGNIGEGENKKSS